MLALQALMGAWVGLAIAGHAAAANDASMTGAVAALGLVMGAVGYPLLWGALVSVVRSRSGEDLPACFARLGGMSLGAGLLLVWPYQFEAVSAGPAVVAFAIAVMAIAVFIATLFDTRLPPAVFLLYALLALVLTGQLYHLAVYNADGNILSVMQGTSPAPWSQRILMPETVRWVSKVFRAHPADLMSVLRVLMLFVLFLATRRTLQGWVSEGWATLAPLLYALMLPLSFDWIYPTDFPELMLVALYLLAMRFDRHGWCVVLMAVGAANREVMAVLAVAHGAHTLIDSRGQAWRQAVLWVGAQAAVFLAVRFAIAQWVGGGAVAVELDRGENIGAIRQYFLWLVGVGHGVDLSHSFDPLPRIRLFTAFAGGGWLICKLWWRDLPPLLLHTMPVVGLLVIAAAWIGGNINETRIFYPILPFLVPGIVTILASQMARRSDEAIDARADRSSISP
jgi:hypothetical protein